VIETWTHPTTCSGCPRCSDAARALLAATPEQTAAYLTEMHDEVQRALAQGGAIPGLDSAPSERAMTRALAIRALTTEEDVMAELRTNVRQVGTHGAGCTCGEGAGDAPTMESWFAEPRTARQAAEDAALERYLTPPAPTGAEPALPPRAASGTQSDGVPEPLPMTEWFR
jgi:hypothetical protein